MFAFWHRTQKHQQLRREDELVAAFKEKMRVGIELRKFPRLPMCKPRFRIFFSNR